MTDIAGGAVRSEHAFLELELDERSRSTLVSAAEAVYAELGLRTQGDVRRTMIASRIASTWRDGRRQPLNLVQAGLDAVDG